MFNLRHDVRKPQARQLRSDSQQMPLIAGFRGRPQEMHVFGGRLDLNQCLLPQTGFNGRTDEAKR